MASLGNITFACEDLRTLAEFWAAALDYDLEEPPPEINEAIEVEGGDLNAAAAAVYPAGDGSRLFLKKSRNPRLSTFRSISTSTLTIGKRKSSDSPSSE